MNAEGLPYYTLNEVRQMIQESDAMSWDAPDAVREMRLALDTMRHWADDEHLSDEARQAYRDCVVIVEAALDGPPR